LSKQAAPTFSFLGAPLLVDHFLFAFFFPRLMAAAARSGELGFKTDDDVRAYVRKRKRANKNCSVSHLRRALNIGYKKAKRIHDEVDDELRRERQERRDRGEEPRHHPSRSRGVSHYDGSDDAEEDDPHHLPIDDDEADLLEEALREYIRKKLRRGEVIYMHHMRDFGLTYRRTRHIVQEFIDQGKIQKLPKSTSALRLFLSFPSLGQLTRAFNSSTWRKKCRCR